MKWPVRMRASMEFPREPHCPQLEWVGGEKGVFLFRDLSTPQNLAPSGLCPFMLFQDMFESLGIILFIFPFLFLRLGGPEHCSWPQKNFQRCHTQLCHHRMPLIFETHNRNDSRSHGETPAGLRPPVSRTDSSLSVLILLRLLGGNQRVDKTLHSSSTHW